MKEAVLMLYGNHGNHPWGEDMITYPELIRDALRKEDLDLHVGMVVGQPTGSTTEIDHVPEIMVARDQEYDPQTGRIKRATFEDGNLLDYPAAFDKWVANFQYEIPQDNNTTQRTALGIGLPPERVWNHRAIQTFGNRKELMDRILTGAGVGLETYRVTNYEQLADEHGGDGEIIFKPQGGSRAVGAAVFGNVRELREALDRGFLAQNGFIQPRIPVANPVKGLKPVNQAEADLLKAINHDDTRPREVRMHVIAQTALDGTLQIDAFPALKFSKPDRRFMDFENYVALDPETAGPGSYLHERTTHIARVVCGQAGLILEDKDRRIKQAYGCVDYIVDGHIDDPAAATAIDGNWRGPGMAPKLTFARNALVQAFAASAKGILEQAA